jgi:peptidoglycan/LPS O-acetylase OafA/YrhL
VNSSGKIGIVGALRGLAALSVCWYHFTHGQDPAWLRWTGNYGWLGVDVFFVISGFIIPYSLYQYRYSVRDFFRFTGKRLARLHPPYLVSIAVVVLLGYGMMLVPRWHAVPPDVSPAQLALHFFYLNDLVGKPWLNVVYWTLGIELQWYLLLGVLFPLIGSRQWPKQIAGALIMLLGFRLITNQFIIFHSVPIFLVGIFVFQYRVGVSSLWRSLLSMAAMFALMKTPIGIPVAVVSLGAGLLITFARLEFKLFNRLGEVSYSLYLLHIPIGLRVIDFTSRLPYAGSYLLLLDVLAIAASIQASILFYEWVEAPSQKWSSAIKIKRADRSIETLVATTASASAD